MTKKSKRSVILFILVLMLIGITCSCSPHLRKKVNVDIPNIAVTVNGHKIDNETTTYPVIVYNDTPYMPITYSGARWLGLTTTWSEVEGFGVEQQLQTLDWQYDSDEKLQENSKRDKAVLCPFTVTVNGKKIDNSTGPNPIIVFRDVVYFPINNEFCEDEFGWKYTYSEESGLVIDSQIVSPAGSLFDGTYTWYYRDGVIYRLNGKSGWPEAFYEFESDAPYYCYFQKDSTGVINVFCQSGTNPAESKKWFVFIHPDGSVSTGENDTDFSVTETPKVTFNDGYNDWFYLDGSIYRAAIGEKAIAVYTFTDRMPYTLHFEQTMGGIIVKCQASDSPTSNDQWLVLFSSSGESITPEKLLRLGAYYDGANYWFSFGSAIYRSNEESNTANLVYSFTDYVPYSVWFENGNDGYVLATTQSSESGITSGHKFIAFTTDGKQADIAKAIPNAFFDGKNTWFNYGITIYRSTDDGKFAVPVTEYVTNDPDSFRFEKGENGTVILFCKGEDPEGEPYSIVFDTDGEIISD